MNRMKKVFKYTALLAVLFCALFALTYALGVMTHPQPLKKVSFVWWPMSEKQFFAENAWATPFQAELKKRGYEFHLITEKTPDGSELLISSDIILIGYPVKEGLIFPFDILKKGTKTYLWAIESPIVMEQPIKLINPDKFEKIFTWRHDLVDNKKTFFVPIDPRVEADIHIKKDISHKRILLSQIASPGSAYGGAQSIYNKRRQATRWWIENHPRDYEFYGKHWPLIYGKLDGNLRPAFKTCYKGYAKDKIKALSEAFFALAFENTVHQDYVSEKIYDVMKAGTVPIYLGAPNVEEFVPKECFINYADFKNDEDLYAFLKAVTPEQYQGYLTCAQRFFDSEQAAQLYPNAIAQKLIDEIF